MKLKQISCLMCMSFSLIVVGCGNQNSSSTSASSPSFTSPVSSTSPFDSSSTLSSSSSSSSSTTTGKTISQLSDLILSTSMNLESDETESATRSIITVAQESFAIKTTATEETLVTYDAPIALTHGTEDITYKSTDEWLGDDYEGFKPRHREYDYFRGVYEGTYYEILDVEGGKEDDSAEKYEIGKGPDQISQLQVNSRTTMTASYIANYYLTNYMATAISESTIFEPKVNGDESTYSIDGIDVQQDDTGVTTTTATLEITFSSDGFLKNYKYDSIVYSKYYDDNGVLSSTEHFTNSVSDEVNVKRGSRAKTPDTPLVIVPTNYWLQTYDVEIKASNISYSDKDIICTTDNIPAGYYITPIATNVYPEKALDIELTVISNTDNDVINLSEHGVFKSIKGGTTTVEISNDGGLLKKLDLTVVEQTIESINLKIYSSHLYVGSEYTIYSYITPGNAIDELEFNVDNPDIAEVVVDDRGYANLVCKSVGEVKVTANSKKNPDVNVTYTYKVTAKLDEDTLKNVLVTTKWCVPETPNQILRFNADGTGLFTDGNTSYNISWSYGSLSGDSLSIIVEPFDYFDILTCLLSADGTTVDFRISNSELWSYAYNGTFVDETTLTTQK